MSGGLADVTTLGDSCHVTFEAPLQLRDFVVVVATTNIFLAFDEIFFLPKFEVSVLELNCFNLPVLIVTLAFQGSVENILIAHQWSTSLKG